MKRVLALCVMSLVCSICACGTTQFLHFGHTTTPEVKPPHEMVSQDASDLERYMVPLASYTTNGALYQKKYLENLYTVAKTIIEGRELLVIEKSIGFYYDKKEKTKDKLFLGVDVQVPASELIAGESYDESARRMTGHYLPLLMEVIYPCGALLKENEIKGVVCGLIWKREGRRELVNVWIHKDDMDLFRQKQVTLNELVIRSTVTDTEGKIMRFAL